MKKKLYIENINSVFCVGEVHFSFKRLYKYIGLNTTDVVFMDDSVKTETLNDSIDIEKLIKSEKSDFKTNCNYEIISNKLENILLKRTFIRLNSWQILLFHIHKRPSIVTWFIGIIIALGIALINCYQKNDQIAIPQEIKNKTLTNMKIPHEPSNSLDSLLLKSDSIKIEE